MSESRMKKIITIPPVKKLYSNRTESSHRKVAGYARVSTELEEQVSSYKAQIEYYTNYIGSREDWEFAGMYADEGKSATTTQRRNGFNAMVQDALEGKIDLILTKSVSRFARNTVDSLSTIRKLKEYGVEVYFEKENIWTFDAKGELLITIMSSLSQEESRSISENTSWGQRRRFAAGKWSAAYSRFLGYSRGINGEIIINRDEAETVREIFSLFLCGYSYSEIARQLMDKGIKAPAGGEKWHPKTVSGILKNEKYAGNALLQKTFTTDFLTKKRRQNTGEVQQYFILDDHAAIIDQETFQLAQAEILRRNGKKSSSSRAFSGMIICGECGGIYGSKIWHCNTAYRKIVWRCNHKYGEYGEKTGCRTPSLSDDEIKALFERLIPRLLKERESITKQLENAIRLLTGDSRMEEGMEKLSRRNTERIVLENARAGLASLTGQTGYSSRLFGRLVEQLTVCSAQEVIFRLFGGSSFTVRRI